MNKGFTPILIVILVAIALSGYVLYQKQTKPIPPIKACTQDSKVCSDGSYVSRIPPNCDFAPCPSPKESTSSAEQSPEKVVEDFYSQFLNCLNCPLNTYQMLDKAFIQSLEQTKAGIFCAANLPKSIKVDKATINDNKAHMLVHTLFESSGDNQIIVGLTSKNGLWKITEITCTDSLMSR